MTAITANERQEAMRGRPWELLQSARGMATELWRDKAGLFGVAVLVGLVGVAVFAPLLAPHDPAAQSISNRFHPPVWADGGSWTNVLGTDALGRDVFSRLIYGTRISLIVGAAVVLVAGTFGVVYGLISGYKGGRADSVMMGVVDTQIAFPGLLLALTILTVVGPSVRNIVIVLAINGWMVYARMTRGVVLSLRETPYVEAAEMLGCRTRRVMLRHLLPNLTSPLLTLSTLEFARIVLAEAALSFLGLGVQPPDASWGLMVAEGRQYINTAWWVITFPGIAISLTVLGVNLFASWLRIAADPQQREKRFARQAEGGGMQ